MHRATAERLGPRVALRSKRLGMYRDLSWADYRRDADRAAAALIDLGIRPGDRVALLSENRPEWLVADIAILATGAADVPLHAPLTPPQARYQLAHSGARAIVVSNQRQADKVLEVLDDLPDLEFLISFEPVDVAGRIRQLTWDGLKSLGSGLGPAALGRVREREDAVTRDDLATIIYTSGTTGPPKGVMLSHGNLLSNAEATLETSAMHPSDVLLSWLPYSHIYARTVDHYLTVLVGCGRRDGRVGRHAGRQPGGSPADADDGDPAVLREGLAGRGRARARGTQAAPAPHLRPPHPAALLGRGAPASSRRGGLPRGGPAAPGGLRPDRELAGDQLQPPRTLQAGLGRPGDPRRRDQDRRRRRDPHARAARHARLLEGPGGHPARRSSTAGCTRATSATSTTKAS